MTARDESRLLQADPTKEFFVFMLTRDIDLDDAVTDLIDNSVDGARRLRAGGHFNGLTVAVTAQQDMFRIADNCGGIEVDIARNYAFRFGRASGTPTTAHSIGQFGVGMKRGLFKIGRNFRIESTSERSRFTVGVNIEEWQTHDRWAFLIDDLEEPDSPFPPERRGTIIEVTNLREDAASQFGLENFQSRLAREIEAKHRRSMLKGLTISLNGVQLKPHNDTILNSDQIQPAYYYSESLVW